MGHTHLSRQKAECEEGSNRSNYLNTIFLVDSHVHLRIPSANGSSAVQCG